MKTKQKLVFATIIATCLIFALVFSPFNMANLKVFASGTSDLYGDRIYEVSIWQNSIMKGNITYNNYTLGVQVKVDAQILTRFNCTVKLNSTFASSTSEAITNTRVYINITYTNGTVIISTTEMTDYTAEVNGDFYLVKSYYTWDDPTHHPIAGVTYYVWFRYEVYR